MAKERKFVLWFNELSIEDVPLVGGKNASLGEMYRELTGKGVRIPNGFAVTAYAYRYLLEKAGIKKELQNILKGLNTKNMHNLSERGKKTRALIRNAYFPKELQGEIFQAYKKLCKQYGTNVDVAVRSSATAEDLPDASFAGQQETFLNIRGEKALLEACRKCFASLFTDRAISYRVEKGFDHFTVALSIGIQKMVRSDKACSGVMFSIDTESGFRNVILINGAWGLGENIVQGAVNPDEFYVFKPAVQQGKYAILSKALGTKKMKMIYAKGKLPVKNVPVSLAEQERFVLNDKEIQQLATWAMIIEKYYSEKAGHFKPMDMEWAKDGMQDKLYIVQARPETVQSSRDVNILEEYVLQQKGHVLVYGHAVGQKIGTGKAKVIASAKQIGQVKKGDVIITEMTDPDWVPVMKLASAIVTDRGGRTCFTGDTILLTNKGFKNFAEIFQEYENLFVPSLNRTTLKIEWKKIRSAMKREGEAIAVNVSQTGRMKENILKLTKDHKVLTYEKRELVEKEIQKILRDEQMLLLAQRIPRISDSTEKEHKLAYLLGAISTDGNVCLSKTHGEVQLIQRPTEEKKEFIETFSQYCEDIFAKRPKTFVKKTSSGFIRGNPVIGNANAYRLYSKQIAQEITTQKQQLVSTLLGADEAFILCFLAGVMDGDGSYNHQANRINIYCSKTPLLEAITVSCLRLGIVPQVTKNRSIFNVQIVEQTERLLEHTKRLKGENKRKIQGTRFFAARQLFQDIQEMVNSKGRIKPFINNNLLIDAEKIGAQILPRCSSAIRNQIERLLASDTRMQRVSHHENLGKQEVYNIEIEDNHNYLVFTDRYTPIVVNNCHAAIVSRELGIPCIVGTEAGTKKIKTGQPVTVSCAEGDAGAVYKGILKYEIKKRDLRQLPKTKTHIMVNIGNPDQAFAQSFLPVQGVGLAREEFIITAHIKIHPNALLQYPKLKDKKIKKAIDELTKGYKNKTTFYVDKLTEGIARIAAAFYPREVILRFSDFKSNEYANLIGGHLFEPKEDNPMIGWRGASRYYDPKFTEAFGLECKAIRRVREEMGLDNVIVMIPMCRSVAEGEKVLAVMKKHGLERKKNGLKVYVMCEVPSNVIMAEAFLELFDGYSIGSNDLTQLTLGVDRDSELVSAIYDERDPAVKEMIRRAIEVANRKGKYVGICGQGPSDHADFAQFLVECGIQSISLNPDTVIKTTMKIAEMEAKMHRELQITPALLPR